MQHRPIKVLLVESDESYLEELQGGLGQGQPDSLEFELVGELSQALARLSQGGFDAILMSLDLPDSTGMVTFDRAYAFAPDVPIIVLTGDPDEETAVATVQGGAQDYLVKDEITPVMLVRAVRHAIERHRLFSALRSLSLIDDLTGLYNRRGFSDLGEQYLKLARRSDIIARLGGDEFGVLALKAADESSELLVERLRERVDDFNDSSPEPYQLSVSIGMAHHDDDLRVRLDDMVAEADSAMYREKHGKKAAALRER